MSTYKGRSWLLLRVIESFFTTVFPSQLWLSEQISIVVISNASIFAIELVLPFSIQTSESISISDVCVVKVRIFLVALVPRFQSF